MADKALIDHTGEILSVEVVTVGPQDWAAQFRVFDTTGLRMFVVSAEEALQVIEVLQTVVARDAEERLKPKPTLPEPQQFAGFGSNFVGGGVGPSSFPGASTMVIGGNGGGAGGSGGNGGGK